MVKILIIYCMGRQAVASGFTFKLAKEIGYPIMSGQTKISRLTLNPI